MNTNDITLTIGRVIIMQIMMMIISKRRTILLIQRGSSPLEALDDLIEELLASDTDSAQ